MEEEKFYIYRIYYGNKIVYVGRTNNINNRIRQHILSCKLIDVRKISKIEFAILDTEADMNLYELYYILKYKPQINSKDATKDELSVELEELQFQPFYSHLYESWKIKAIDKWHDIENKQFRLNQIKDLMQSETTEMGKDILETQYFLLKDKGVAI